jgi:hypothetical protein
MNFGEAFSQYAHGAKVQKDIALGNENEPFSTGYLNGFHRVITLMQQQAEVFDISLREIGIDIDENDLI